MAKRSNNTGVILGISALGIIAKGIILWLVYEINKKSTIITKKDSENDNLKSSLLDLDNQRNYWQNSYYSQSSCLQQFQHIPHPKESIKKIIEQLERLKIEVFKEKPDFAKELDDSIHALKGENFNLLSRF